VEQLVDYFVMTGVDILIISVLPENTVQKDVLEPETSQYRRHAAPALSSTRRRAVQT